jgi:triacylglycerol lipase
MAGSLPAAVGSPLLLALLLVLLAAAAAGGLRWWRRHRRPRLRRRRRVPPRPRYPVVLVHGLFGFDEIELGQRRHAYFRGVRGALERDGHAVRVARVALAGSIASRAGALARCVGEVESRRVNVVAHSMGGLDARYAIARLGLDRRVAALVTVGTPHHGSPLADVSGALTERLGLARALAAAGVSIDAFRDLTSASLARFNDEVPDAPGVAYASVVGRVRRTLRTSPLLVPSYLWLSRTAGPNDGVVPTTSQRWGEVLAEIEADHWAQIGWSKHFDAAGFYRDLLRELRALGF